MPSGMRCRKKAPTSMHNSTTRKTHANNVLLGREQPLQSIASAMQCCVAWQKAAAVVHTAEVLTFHPDDLHFCKTSVALCGTVCDNNMTMTRKQVFSTHLLSISSADSTPHTMAMSTCSCTCTTLQTCYDQIQKHACHLYRHS